MNDHQERSPRNRRIVLRYFLRCMGFGLAMGAVFLVYAGFFATFRSPAASFVFDCGCIVAGLIVGVGSFFIGKVVILGAVDQVRMSLETLNGGTGVEEIDLVSGDGIGRLTASFNAVLGRLKGTALSLAKVAEGTQAVGFELAANATETAAASEQISRHMELVHEQTQVLIGEIARVDEARRAIRSSAGVVSENINSQSDSLTALSSSVETIAEELKALAGATAASIQAISSTIGESGRSLGIIEQSTARIRDIAESVGSIAGWAASINDIAGTISLLGMNASIEAARAGAAGRGFAVVAGEIGKLSVLVAQKSSEINKGLKEVVARVDGSVAFASANQNGLAGLLKRSEESAGDIRGISERIADIAAKADGMLAAHNNLVKVTISVTDSMMGMRDHTNAIEDSVNILIDTSDRYKGAIEEISVGIREIAVDVEHLNKVSEANAENTRALKAEIAKFGL